MSFLSDFVNVYNPAPKSGAVGIQSSNKFRLNITKGITVEMFLSEFKLYDAAGLVNLSTATAKVTVATNPKNIGVALTNNGTAGVSDMFNLVNGKGIYEVTLSFSCDGMLWRLLAATHSRHRMTVG